MSYNIEKDHAEIYQAEFINHDGKKVAQIIRRAIKTYTPEDLHNFAMSFGQYDDDTYENVSNVDFLKETAKFYEEA